MTTTTLAVPNIAAIEMEESILGSVLLDPDIATSITLPITAFAIRAHRLIYKAITSICDSGHKPDLLTILHKLKASGELEEVGGKSKLAQLMDRIVHTGNTQQYVEILKSEHERELALIELKKISELAETEDIDKAIALAKEKIDNLESLRGNATKVARVTSRKSSFEQVMQVVGAMFEQFEDDPARLEWEWIQLAQELKIPKNELKMMYRRLKEESEKAKARNVVEFIAETSADREWFIGGHIPKGTTICLFADGGTGKTLLSYDLAKAIALGTHWNGFKASQGRVLIVQSDESDMDTREHLATAGFNNLPPDMVHILTKWQFSQMKHLEKMIDELGIEFIIIDSLTSCNRIEAENEKDASYAAPLYDLRDIASKRGCTFLILHHENKGGGARGTTAIRNNVSEVWRLRKGEKVENLLPTQRILEFDKSRSSLYGSVKLELNVEDYSWMHLGEVGQDETPVGKLPLSARLLNYLETNRGVRFEPEELTHEFTGSTKDAIRKALERHRKQGVILSEERIRQREVGAVRYKVYYSPSLSSEAQTVNPPYTQDGMSSEAETLTSKEFDSMDTENTKLTKKVVSSDKIEFVQRVEPSDSKHPDSLDTGILDMGGVTAKKDYPAVGARVTINAGSKNFDGLQATVIKHSKDGDEWYCTVKLDADGGNYSGYELDYKPEALLW